MQNQITSITLLWSLLSSLHVDGKPFNRVKEVDSGNGKPFNRMKAVDTVRLDSISSFGKLNNKDSFNKLHSLESFSSPVEKNLLGKNNNQRNRFDLSSFISGFLSFASASGDVSTLLNEKDTISDVVVTYTQQRPSDADSKTVIRLRDAVYRKQSNSKSLGNKKLRSTRALKDKAPHSLGLPLNCNKDGTETITRKICYLQRCVIFTFNVRTHKCYGV